MAPAAHGADRIYWSNYNGNKISYANLDGSGGGDVATTGATVDGPMALAIDPAHGKVYWANWQEDGFGTIISYANLDGSGGGDLPIFPGMVNGPHGLAIDPVAGKIYWPNDVTDTISTANIDGSAAENLITDGATVAEPRGVTLDLAAGRIYWANYDAGTGTTISYANLDGSGGDDLMTVGASIGGPEGVAIDPAAGKIYWGSLGTAPGGKIASANLDGSGGAQDLATAPAVPNRPHGVALDPTAGRIYWADYGDYAIYYAKTDGSGGGELTTTGATMSGPALPALLKVPAGTGAPAISGGATLGAILSCTQGSWAPDLLGSLLYRAPEGFSYQWSRDGTDVPGATSNSITATSPGDYRCRVTAGNEAGPTAQTSVAHTVNVDNQAPETTIQGGPSGPTNNASPSFTFTSSEANSTFECRIDSAAFSACSSAKSYSNLANGAHTFEVRATDQAANTDPTPASRGFNVDTQAPAVSIQSGPSGPTSDSTPSFGFSSEAGASVQCSVDQGSASFAACSGATSHTPSGPLADGSWTFRVRATDAATNQATATRSFRVDAQAPETSITSAPDRNTRNSSPSFFFISSEANSTFECRIDSGAYSACSSAKSYSHLADGPHTFQVRATDQAATIDQTPAIHSFRVDTKAPKVSMTNHPPHSINANHNTVKVAFGFRSEPGVSFQCKLDSAAFAHCSSPRTYHIRPGKHTFSVKATDRVRNTGSPASFAFALTKK